MASSEVAISNMALARIGVTTFISSLSERSQEANVCSLFYEPCRDFVLSDDYDWNFASKRTQLSNLGSPPTNWQYRYALPSDCLKARNIVIAGMPTPRSDQRIPFEVSVENEAKVLYTDQPLAELLYTRRVTDPNLFSPSFIMAFAWYLGSEIAFPLSVSQSIATKAFQMYAQVIARAGASSMNESQKRVEPESEFISGRN
tara:strand:+ start:447327 stop:447929 length:603 start_codon:yes stop_codon:yes gene_type:complete